MDIDHFQAKLLARRAELDGLADTAAAAAATVELDQTRVGRLSRMDALQGQAMAQATQARRKAELGRIAAALERMDAGDYGDCTSCGEPIAEARLDIDPAAVICIACAEARER